MDEVHEESKVRGEYDLHICESNEDFEELKGFDVWSTTENFKTGEVIYQCSECEFSSKEKDDVQ